MGYRTPRRMNMGSPTDKKCQRMIDPLAPFIRWQMIFQGITRVQPHATKEENLGAPLPAGLAFSSTEYAGGVRSQGVSQEG